MKEFYFILGSIFYLWAGYSAIRMLFTVNSYTGFEWILSIIIEAGFGMYFMCDSAFVSGYAFAYIFWAFWLPSFGYMSALDEETNGLTCFALTQCCLSLIVLCISLSIVSFYMSLHDMCTDCQQQFEEQDGMCYQNNSKMAA